MLKNIFEIIQKNVLPERTGRQYSRSNRRTKFNRTHQTLLNILYYFNYVNIEKRKQNRWLNLVIDFIKIKFSKKITHFT